MENIPPAAVQASVFKKQHKFQLKDKVFHLQDSTLTQLYSSPHLKAACNIILVYIISAIVLNAVRFSFDLNDLQVFLEFVQYVFVGFQHFILFDIIFHVLIFVLAYPLIKWWIRKRHGKKETYLDDLQLGLGMGTFLTFIYAYALYLVHSFPISPSMKFAILVEKVRLTMKLISLMIECSKKQERSASKDDKIELQNFLSSKKLLYFLFAPTLLYRDHYPLTQRIRWSAVISYSAQFLFGLLALSIFFHRMVIPVYSKIVIEPISRQELVEFSYTTFLAGGLFYFSAFYLTFECWLNIWAELLKFGDRAFYKDFWNSTNGPNYLRKWNCVVYDWIYAYSYVWILNKTSGNKSISALAVFVASSLIHEYVMIFTFGFVLPVISIQFIGLGIFTTVTGMLTKRSQATSSNSCNTKDLANREDKPSSHNLLHFWFILSQILGWSFQFLFFTLEHFAHQRCPIAQASDGQSYFSLYSFKCVRLQ